MITALSTPQSGRIILDSNNTVIRIQSTNGEGHYFRAKIFIDGGLFDEQSWSRSDAYTAEKDLKKLYHSYFATAFSATFIPGVYIISNLRKLVSINIEEYNIDTGELTAQLVLPPFEILYNVKPTLFLDTLPLVLLGMDAPVMVVPATGKIVVPFYANSEAERGNVVLTTDSGLVVEDLEFTPEGKKVFVYRHNLASQPWSYNILYFTVTITLGGTTVKQVYKVNRLPDYPLKEIAFRNNFGFYLYAYLDGEMEITNSFNPLTYEAADGSERVFEVNEEATYSINSGSLLANEKEVLNMIANTVDAKFKNGNTWLTMVTATKKQTGFKDRQHAYNEKLQFTLRKGTDVANTGMITVAGDADIVIDGHFILGEVVYVNFHFNNGFAPANITIQVRTSPAVSWQNVPGPPAGPRTFTRPPGVYYVRLADTANMSNVSEQITVTVV